MCGENANLYVYSLNWKFLKTRCRNCTPALVPKLSQGMGPVSCLHKAFGILNDRWSQLGGRNHNKWLLKLSVLLKRYHIAVWSFMAQVLYDRFHFVYKPIYLQVTTQCLWTHSTRTALLRGSYRHGMGRAGSSARCGLHSPCGAQVQGSCRCWWSGTRPTPPSCGSSTEIKAAGNIVNPLSATGAKLHQVPLLIENCGIERVEHFSLNMLSHWPD